MTKAETYEEWAKKLIQEGARQHEAPRRGGQAAFLYGMKVGIIESTAPERSHGPRHPR